MTTVDKVERYVETTVSIDVLILVQNIPDLEYVETPRTNSFFYANIQF